MPKPRASREHLLGKKALAVWAVLIIVGFIGVSLYARTILTSGQMAAVITSSLVELTNEDRQEASLGTLKVNPLLVAAAQAKANDMAEKGYFAHTSPEGLTPWHWFGQAGYRFAYAGENLAVNFSDSEDVVRAWMHSPTHRANILNGRFTEIGIATAIGEYKGKRTVFVVQMFGTLSQAAYAAPIAEIVPEDPLELAVATTELAEREVAGAFAEKSEFSTAVAAAARVPDAVPAEPVAPEANSISEASPAAEATILAASPKSLLRNLYLLGGVLLLFTLAVITRLEWKRHHMRHVVGAMFLFLLMGGLFTLADRFLFPTPVIGQEMSV